MPFLISKRGKVKKNPNIYCFSPKNGIIINNCNTLSSVRGLMGKRYGGEGVQGGLDKVCNENKENMGWKVAYLMLRSNKSVFTQESESYGSYKWPWLFVNLIQIIDR